MPTHRFAYRSLLAAALVLLASVAIPAAAQTKLALGMSGWTGFAPLSLADKAGIFKKNGLEVDLKMIPQKDRHLVLASGGIQCAASTVDSFVVWNANGVPVTQIFQMDKSHGADGLAVRNDVRSFTDLKGKTVGVDAPGTVGYFTLLWMLGKNGMTIKDVKTVSLQAQAAAAAFLSGQIDAAMTYEPYLSSIRSNPNAGKTLATTLDYPVVMDTVGCVPAWLKDNPKAAQALADSYFQALDMIKTDPTKAYELMGASVKQTGQQFGKSSEYLRWQDKSANQKFFAGDLTQFMNDALPILLEAGVIRKAPTDLSATFDASYVK